MQVKNIFGEEFNSSPKKFFINIWTAQLLDGHNWLRKQLFTAPLLKRFSPIEIILTLGKKIE